MKINRNLFDEGWKYISCYEDSLGHLMPMGYAKNKNYAEECAKKHKQILCRLVKIVNYKSH